MLEQTCESPVYLGRTSPFFWGGTGFNQWFTATLVHSVRIFF